MTTPDTTMGSAPRPPRRAGRTRRIVLIVGLVIVLVVAGGAAGLEAWARGHYSNCIASQLDKSLGTKVSVHFGLKPLVFTYFDHNVGSVTVDANDAQFGPATGVKVHATLDDIALKNANTTTVGGFKADAIWGDDSIAQSLGGLVSGVQSNPAAGTLDIKALGGLGELQLRPHIVGNQIQVDTVNADVLGFGIPTDLVDGIVKTISAGLQNYPLNVSPTALKVTDTGIDVTLSGSNITLQNDPNATINTTC